MKKLLNIFQALNAIIGLLSGSELLKLTNFFETIPSKIKLLIFLASLILFIIIALRTTNNSNKQQFQIFGKKNNQTMS